MSALFSSPPKPPEPIKPADEGDTEIQKKKAAQRAAMQAGGRSSTILTSPTGSAAMAPVATKTLLGA